MSDDKFVSEKNSNVNKSDAAVEMSKKMRERFEDLKQDRQTWDTTYKDIKEFMFWMDGRFLDQSTKPNDGTQGDGSIIDSEPIQAREVLAAGMQSGLTSPARPWFKLSLDDRDLVRWGPVKNWLEMVGDTIRRTLFNSNFYQSTHSNYYELGGFGTSVMFLEEDAQDVIRAYPCTVGEYYLSTDERLRIDTVYRVMWMKARNILSWFGEENVSNSVKSAMTSNNGDEYFRIVHAVEPNGEAEFGKIDSVNKPIRSAYFELDASDRDGMLRIKGFDDFPVMAPRWTVGGSDVYGRGPGMIALSDSKMLQTMQAQGMEALAKMINPPMNAPIGMKNQPNSTIPGSVNFIDNRQGTQTFQPVFQTAPDYRSLEFKNDLTQRKIRNAFFTDVFLTIINAGKNMTATEVAERHEEKLLMLGPVIERVQPEFLDKAIERTVNILARSGKLPPPPPELVGRDYQIEYISVLAQAQKLVGTTAIEQTAAFTGNLAGIKPDTIDVLDLDEAVYEYADMTGVPSPIVRTRDAVKKLRKGRADRQAAQQAIESGTEAAKGAELLSRANTGENNALTQVLAGLT